MVAIRSISSALLLVLAAAPLAEARSTNACFTKEETRKMILVREEFSKEASKCLQFYWNTHARFHNQNKYSKYFGNRSKSLNTSEKRQLIILNVLWPQLLNPNEQRQFLTDFYKDKVKDKDGDLPTPVISDLEKWMEKSSPATYQSYKERKPSLKLEERAEAERGEDPAARGSDLQPNTNGKLQNISCIDMTRRCLRMGFEKVGMLDTFKKIDAEVLKNDVSGVELQKALIDLGWKSFYWNPDTTQNAAWDADDQQILPPTAAKPWQGAWGGHTARWSRNCNPDGTKKDPTKSAGVQCSGEYFLGRERPLLIDDRKLLVDFGTSVPPVFTAVPFFVGSGHSGYHIFPGFQGQIIEAHSQRGLRSIDNLEVSKFNPLDQGNRGGPRWTRSEKYRSGVIVIPPGYIENGPLRMHEPQMDGACVDLHPSKP